MATSKTYSARVVLVHGWRPSIGDQTVLSPHARLAAHKLWRMLAREELGTRDHRRILEGFRRYEVEAVLAEYGEMGVLAAAASRARRGARF